MPPIFLWIEIIIFLWWLDHVPIVSTSTQIMGLKSKLNKTWYTFDFIDFFTNRSWELVMTPLFVHVHTYIPTATGYLHILASMSVLRFYEKLIPIRHFWAWGKNGDGLLAEHLLKTFLTLLFGLLSHDTICFEATNFFTFVQTGFWRTSVYY